MIVSVDEELEMARIVIADANLEEAMEQSRLAYARSLPGYIPTFADDMIGVNPYTAGGDRKVMQRLINGIVKRAKAEQAWIKAEALKYPNGALCITRTPSRRYCRYSANLEDIIQKDKLVSAFCQSFSIHGADLYKHLPFSRTSNDVPIYIGCDINTGKPHIIVLFIKD